MRIWRAVYLVGAVAPTRNILAPPLAPVFHCHFGFPSVVTSFLDLRASQMGLGLLWCLCELKRAVGGGTRGTASSRQAACLSWGAPTDFLLCCRFRLRYGDFVLVIQRCRSGCPNTHIAGCALGLLGYSEGKKMARVTMAQAWCLTGGSAASPQKALPTELLRKRGCAS